MCSRSQRQSWNWRRVEKNLCCRAVKNSSVFIRSQSVTRNTTTVSWGWTMCRRKAYAKNVIQLYKQIVNYLAGKFELDKHYEKKDIFGVVVVLEDAVVSRKKVYDKVFLELERTAHLDDEEKRYIHSHIKVLPLREVETFMLQNMSPLPFLVEQVENENQWDNYRYGCPQKENGLIAEYESYVKKLKSMLIARIRTV